MTTGLFRRSIRSDASMVASSGPAVPAASLNREEEFIAYTEECRIFGFIQLETERLSDTLNLYEEFHLSSVLVVALEDHRTAEALEFTVRRDELIAVRAGGQRGNVARRSRTRPAPIVVKAGAYLIHGYLHTRPGANPLLNFRSRKVMVPLTGARIEYMADGEVHRARIGTIVVNRELVEWTDYARDEDVRLDLPVETSIDPRAKDLTGYVQTWVEPSD